MIILIIALVTSVILIFMFRIKIQEILIEKRIESSKRRLVQFNSNTSDIDQIVDSLFFEMKQKSQIPTKDSILDAYNDLIIGKIEKNIAFSLPSLNVDEIERLIDRRIQAEIEAEVDKLWIFLDCFFQKVR